MNQSIIVYPGGCYGTFFEWIFNFLEDPGVDTPFQTNGNSHDFTTGNFFEPQQKLFDHINNGKNCKFSRIHPGIFEIVNHHELPYRDSYDRILQQDLDLLKSHFNKILVLTYDQDSVLWVENNIDKTILNKDIWDNSSFNFYGYSQEFMKANFEKDSILRIKHLLDQEVKSKLSPFKISNLTAWNKTSIYDFDIWDLRELLSFYWFTRSQGQIAAWDIIKTNNPDIKVISISALRSQENFIKTVRLAAQHVGVQANAVAWEKLKQTYDQWASLQLHINKDALCNKIVNSIIKTESLDWSDTELSIIDEAYIQKTLYDAGIDIKCNNLNVFPTNTQDFIPLLEYTRTAQI